ncbi:hypothetical protein [Candidatus Sulfurimonas baltica]|uniref:Uncharacterized protein n=1 Tax=Candidatus Sulfurimonas baltica TaxID=2740404 RepID=A0A7S7RP29_9BACT|nr:hypothetical protein [Candidatus Sulfurimonas baltica]QOY53144.1 hypothetical protein HUE88_05550 [Candidatus Sulfurimonas baltica]
MSYYTRVGYREVVGGYQVIIVGEVYITKHFKLFSTSEDAINFIQKIIAKENLVEGFTEGVNDCVNINKQYWSKEESLYHIPNTQIIVNNTFKFLEDKFLCIPTADEQLKNKTNKTQEPT